MNDGCVFGRTQGGGIQGYLCLVEFLQREMMQKMWLAVKDWCMYEMKLELAVRQKFGLAEVLYWA